MAKIQGDDFQLAIDDNFLDYHGINSLEQNITSGVSSVLFYYHPAFIHLLPGNVPRADYLFFPFLKSFLSCFVKRFFGASLTISDREKIITNVHAYR